jgi:mannosyltransferase
MNRDKTNGSDTSRADAAILLLIVALAVFLRFYRLDFQSLWYDEAYTASVTNPASVGLSYIWSSGPVAYMPPLHHTIVYLSRLVGTGEVSLRLPSVLAGILTVILIYVTAKYCFNRRVGAFAALIATVSTFHVYYSQEARAYALLMLLSIASTYFLVRALREKRRVWWLLYVAGSALGMYTHLFMAFVLLAQNVYLLMEWEAKRVSGRAWVFSQIGTILLFSPWLLTNAVFYKEVLVGVGGAAERADRDLWMPTPYPALPLAMVGIFFHGGSFDIEPIAGILNLGHQWSAVFAWPVEAIHRIFVPYLLLAAIALWRLRKRIECRRHGILIGVMLMLPLVLMFAVSLHTRILNERYFSFAYPYFCVLIALGIDTFNNRGMKTLLLAVVIVVNCVGLASYYFNPFFQRASWREVAHLLDESARPSAIILVYSSNSLIALDYYYSGSATAAGLRDPVKDSREETWSYLQGVMAGRTEAWLIVGGDWGGGSALYGDLLREHCRKVGQPQFNRIDVALYDSCRL